MENETKSDDLLFRVHFLALNKNPNYPAKQLWQLTKDHLEFLNTIDHLDEMTKIKIQVITFELLEKIVTPKLDDYVNSSIDVPMEEIYGDQSHIVKKIYESDFEEQKLLDVEKIKALINRILYLPALLLSNLEEKDIVLIKKQTENETLNKIIFDKQEEERKKIDSMVKFYIDACERNTTHKPKGEMLVAESGINIALWKTRLNQEIFLKLLLDEIMKKMNQAKIPKKKEFWQKALVRINNRIDIIGDSYEFKRRSIDPNRSNQDTNYAVSLSDRVEAERIHNEEGVMSTNDEKVCDICGDYIDKGFRCDDCKDLFGDNK